MALALVCVPTHENSPVTRVSNTTLVGKGVDVIASPFPSSGVATSASATVSKARGSASPTSYIDVVSFEMDLQRVSPSMGHSSRSSMKCETTPICATKPL